MSQPCWLKVLDHFLKRSYVQNGLTLPFLIGSELILDSNKEKLSIQQILGQMYDNGLRYHISIMFCGDIREYIFGILDPESININKQKSIYRTYNNLSITDESFSSSDSLESIQAELEAKYEEHIYNEEFSKQHGKWTRFSTEEMTRITEAIDTQ